MLKTYTSTMDTSITYDVNGVQGIVVDRLAIRVFLLGNIKMVFTPGSRDGVLTISKEMLKDWNSIRSKK